MAGRADMVQVRVPHGLERDGIENPGPIYWNLSIPALYEEALRRREGLIAQDGPIVFETGKHTGRSPGDKFVVRNPESEGDIWWGTVNQPLSPEAFDALHRRILSYLNGKEIFVQDLYAAADPRYSLPIRVITETAYHSMFSRNMFINPAGDLPTTENLPFTVIDIPSFHADPVADGTHSDVFVVLNLEKRLILIGGTSYAGEIKKAIFTVLNYLLPKQGILSMHCSANYGAPDDVALFFGLSGTGKTTLSTDRHRTLIGDDEHGWSDRGVFNFEGGCYVKTIKIRQGAEPELFAAVHRFGTVLENVVMDPVTRRLDLDSTALTENTRASFPLSYIPNVDLGGMASHPRNILFLSADAFGVLPPVARLTREQAQYYFLSGYTAKVAGTEKGVTDPVPNFSNCFGAPFMVWPPMTYARLLGEHIAKHDSAVWLINTGWTGGPFGSGHRIDIAATRAIVHAAVSGHLLETPGYIDANFGLYVPEHVRNVPDHILRPRDTWADPAAYDRQARKLARMFKENFDRHYRGNVSPEIAAAGPQPD